MIKRFRTLLLAASLALAVPALADDAADLNALLAANRWEVTVTPAGLAGPGAERLLGWAEEAQFFMLGEEHGSAGIARLATAFSRSLRRLDYRYTAIEVDPLMTELMLRELRGGTAALVRFLADGRQQAIPFYGWDAEADFVLAAMEGGGAVWGMDQSFIIAAPVHFAEIARRTRSPQVRAEAEALAKEARADNKFLGKVDAARLTKLRDAIPPEEADVRTIVEQLLDSAAIYAPYITNTGGYYAANLRRETSMKRLLLTELDKAERRDGKPAKVLFKFGANHLMRGLSLTNVPSLGGFVSELALSRYGKTAFNVAMLCGPGGQTRTFDGASQTCDKDFEESFPGLKPHLSGGVTLFDVRALRDRPRLWKAWPEQAKSLIWAYDALAVVSGGGPSNFLAPLPAKPAQ
ncbi:MAG: hypothetical protein V4808_08925 [Pseudomonadota bacterium]